MRDEISSAKLKTCIGKQVEVIAFGLSYTGLLKKVDVKSGLIRVEDKEDYVVLEVERIESFKIIPR